MHFLHSIILLLGIIYTVTSAPQLPNMGDNCKVGDTKMDKCNRCECESGFEGTVWLCENEVCEGPTVDIGSQLPAGHSYDKCFKGEILFDGCNWCNCMKDNVMVCTEKACNNDERKPRPSKGKGYFAGEKIYTGCNWCSAGKDGRTMACTYMACPVHQNEETKPRLPQTGDECKIGDTKMDKCNPCECKLGYEGSVWDCKNKICEGPSVDIGSQLPPGHSYDKCFKGEILFDGCNWCNCMKDNVLACHRMACNKDLRKPRPSSGFFVGETVYDGCNRCSAGVTQYHTFVSCKKMCPDLEDVADDKE